MDASAAPDPRVLVGVADPEWRSRLVAGLRADALDVEGVADAPAMVASARAMPPDVVMVDGALPGDDAMDAVRDLRERSDCYIVVLAPQPDEVAAVLALSLGADDVVPASTTPRELAARARAMLRRPRAPVFRGQPVHIACLTVDPMAREATGPGGAIPLTRIEFDILWALADAQRAVVDRARLTERVWGPRWVGDEHLLDVHVSNLRGKLRAAGAGVAITTVRGVGFRAEPAD